MICCCCWFVVVLTCRSELRLNSEWFKNLSTVSKLSILFLLPFPQALHKLKQQTTEARNLATEYFNQTSSLYQTSATVITQVNAAVERSANLSNEVRTVLTNSTQGHQYSNSALTAARDAVSRANRVHGHAQRMLSVANNFQNESRLAQAYANKSLLGAALIQNVTLQIIQEVSTVNESSVSILFTAQEAARLGNIVKNLSDSERQVGPLIINLQFYILETVKKSAQFKRRIFHSCTEPNSFN